jgi:3-hydroxyisobutyrate dehydrogenase-like beta-hydroxyacid dehydrogenase
MGISVAATIKNGGCAVLWASQGRSERSKARAAEHGLTDVGTTAELVRRADALMSVCPPAAAEAVADQVIGSGFQGLFLDANAIAPESARRIGRKLKASGITFVDGGIIGGPAWQPGRTWLYLSGPEAETAVPLSPPVHWKHKSLAPKSARLPL